MNISTPEKEYGFTIIEIIIVISISLVLLAGLLQLFEWHQKIFVLEEATVRTTNDVRNTLFNIGQYIAQGSEIEASRVISGQTYTSGNDVIVLGLPSVNGSNNIISNTFDFVTIYLDSGSVRIIIEPGSGSIRPAMSKQLAENVSNFLLTYNGANPSQSTAVTIDMQTQIITRHNNVNTSVSDTIFLRNH